MIYMKIKNKSKTYFLLKLEGLLIYLFYIFKERRKIQLYYCIYIYTEKINIYK